MSAQVGAASPLTFKVRLRPNADGPLNVWVSQPAVDGAANKALLKVVANALKVRPRQLSISAGHKSRTKTPRLDEPAAGTAELLSSWRTRGKQ